MKLKQVSIAEAHDRLANLVRQAEEDGALELTRRGKPVAVLMSIQEYQRLTRPESGFWEAFTAFRNKIDLRLLDIQPETFDDLRDSAPGRGPDHPP